MTSVVIPASVATTSLKTGHAESTKTVASSITEVCVLNACRIIDSKEEFVASKAASSIKTMSVSLVARNTSWWKAFANLKTVSTGPEIPV